MKLAPKTILATLLLAGGLSGCGVAKTTAKVATLPVKATVKTGEVAGKSVYYTGKGAYHTGKFAGNAAYQTGKGVYYVGSVPVKITDKALDTTSKVLTVTTQAVDLTGKVVVYTKQIQAANLDAELANIKRMKNIISVLVDAA